MVSPHTPHAKSEESQVKCLCSQFLTITRPWQWAIDTVHREQDKLSANVSIKPSLTVSSLFWPSLPALWNILAPEWQTIKQVCDLYPKLRRLCSLCLVQLPEEGKRDVRVYQDKLSTQTYTSIHSHTYTQSSLKFHHSWARVVTDVELRWGNERVIALVAEKGCWVDRAEVHQQLAHREEFPPYRKSQHRTCYTFPPVFSPQSVFLRLLSFWDLQGHHCRFGLKVLVET